MSLRRIRLLYVCDFSSIHARTYIEYFAGRSQEYSITVISTKPARQMQNVELLELHSARVPSTLRRGRLGVVTYQLALAFPWLSAHVRVWEDIWRTRRDLPKIRRIMGSLEFDIIHAFRTVPEAVLALEIRRAFPQIPFFVSTWGQDFVTWAVRNRVLETWTRSTVQVVDVLLPDNERDDRLARQLYGLPFGAQSVVMPATGGLDVENLGKALDECPSLSLQGTPSLLSMRGYENIYVRVRVLLQAMRFFVHHCPDAHLYLDGPAGHPGRNTVERWISEMGLGKHVTLLHLDRAQLFQYMRSCDLYASATSADGLPMSLLEALYFGQVPVVYNHESTHEVFVDGVSGVTFATLDPEVIATAWRRALELVPERVRRTEQNRQRILDQFSRDTSLARISEVYHQHVKLNRQ